MNRRVTVKQRAMGEEENPMRAYDKLTPAERIALVWELTLQALEFQGHSDAEPRLSRHLVRTLSRRG